MTVLPTITGSIVPQLLSAAVVGALSPVASLVAIMLLGTQRPVANTVAYLLGWSIVLMALAGGLVALLSGHQGASGTSAKAAVELVVGLMLLCVALRNLLGERHPLEGPMTGEHPVAEAVAPSAPGWMARLDTVTPPLAFVVGMVLIAISPADLAAYFSGLQALIGSDLSGGETVLLVALLLIAIDSCIVIPLVVYVAFPHRADGWLAAAKTWLIAHSRAVTGGAAGVFGLLLLIDGIVALA